MFPTEILETSAQRKILRVLAEKNKQYTIDELSEMCHRSRATVSRALKKADRYSFIEKNHVPESKKLVFKLNPESRYTESIKLFFETEKNLERQNGTVPVDVWNLLEDITNILSRKMDCFIELFLFGSYATGEYHAKSDIDLLLLHTTKPDALERADSLLREMGDGQIQLATVEIKKDELKRKDDRELLDAVKSKSPVRDVDILIPLSGRVKP